MGLRTGRGVLGSGRRDEVPAGRTEPGRAGGPSVERAPAGGSPPLASRAGGLGHFGGGLPLFVPGFQDLPGAFSLSGGGSDPLDFIGASVTSEVKMSGHYKFHYDESLAELVPKSLIVDSWNEVSPRQATDLSSALAALPLTK